MSTPDDELDEQNQSDWVADQLVPAPLNEVAGPSDPVIHDQVDPDGPEPDMPGLEQQLEEAVDCCMHPDCLSKPDVWLEAQWSPTDWEQFPVCISHIPAGVNSFMRHEHDGRGPAVVAIQLHDFPTS